MAQSGAIDASELRDFAKAVRKASKSTGTKFRLAEKSAAQVIADRAAEIIGDTSSKVAATIRPFTQGASAGVQTGSDSVPLARLLEIGNDSSLDLIARSAREGGFRHPVFPTGDRSTWHWNNEHPQPMHPYLAPAVNEKKEEFEELLVKGVNDAFSGVRLEWE